MQKTVNPYNTEDKTSYIITHYSEMGGELEEEVFGLDNAIKALEEKWSIYETFSGGSMSNLMAEPSLCHPDGSGLLWSLEKNDWE